MRPYRLTFDGEIECIIRAAQDTDRDKTEDIIDEQHIVRKNSVMQPKQVKIRVTPGARAERIVAHFDSLNQEVLCVYVTARAHNDKANQAVIKALSAYWSIPQSYIRIKHGLRSRDKMILVHQVQK